MQKDFIEDRIGWRYLLVLLVVAYLFSIGIRLIWVDWASSMPQFFWNGQLMINTNDGYYFASAVQKELFGTLQHNPRVPDLWYTATVTLSYFAAKFLPFSLDTLILYMPAVVSSFVVIPVILIFRLYNMTIVGFFAALLASITWSYYNRTMAGYYDTDMFSAMAPMFIVYFLMAANHRKSVNFALLGALAIVLYPFLYDQGKAMVFAVSTLYILYVWFMHRKESFAYPAIAIVAAALLPLFWPLKLLAVLLVYIAVKSKKVEPKKIEYLAWGLTIAYLVTGDGVSFIYNKIVGYIERDTIKQGLQFYNVMGTIREAGHIPFDLLAKRIAGSVPGFFIAIAGYTLLLMRYRAFVVTLPLMGLGLFAWWGGLRFTVYAVPVAAMGAVYLFYAVALYLKREKMRYAVVAVGAAALLYPNIKHVLDYKVPTVFNSFEVEVLDKLKGIGSDKDYVIAWWDYGYPIWYYANKNTLIDGGKHANDNFIVSKILTTTSQLEAARLSRIAVETYVSSDYKTIADTIFKSGKADQIDPNKYLEILRTSDSFKLPKKSRDIYIFLPWRMNSIFPTVSLFSNLNLLTGEKLHNSVYMVTSMVEDKGKFIKFENGAMLDKQKGELILGSQKAPINKFIRVKYNEKKKIVINTQNIYPNSQITLLFAESYGKFFIIDERTLNSLYIQLFIFENYNPNLFEPVVLSPWGKVYRVKL